QISVVGPMAFWQTSWVPWQIILPETQAPVPQLPPGQQVLPTVATSSTLPLQSSSRPLHTSVPGPTAPMHCRVPPEHCCVPALQMPVPQLPAGQQVLPTPETSSVVPLQSSSRPLHVSVPGSTWPTHGPNAGTPLPRTAVHCCV